MNKDYMFENSEQNQFYQARMNSRERLLRNQQILLDRQVSESQNPGFGKRDLIWDMKKNQKLSGQNVNPMPNDQPFYPPAQSSFELPYIQNPSGRDFSNQENYFQPSELRAPYQPMSNLNDSYSPNPNPYQNRPGLHSDYSEKPRPDSGKRLEMEKKRLYAEELKRQIEEKNQIRAAEAKTYQKRENLPENESRPRFASADRPNSNIFGQENLTRMSEREKKLKYARELEAQIQQKRNNPAGDRERNDQLFNYEQGPESASEKKKKYAKELEEQIRNKNSGDFRENPKRRENDDSKNRELWPKTQDEQAKNDGNKLEIDKKAWYRQELERQIEDQKKRKEEEKKRRKIEDGFVEVGIFDAKKDLNRAPGRDQPRNRENFDIVKDPFEDLQKNIPGQGFNKFARGNEAEGKKDIFEEPPENNFESKKMNLQDLPNQFTRFRPANEILTPFEQEKAVKNMDLFKVPSQNEVNPSNILFEKIMKEMQEVKKERDQAREQCMEMREMMLKEKEKNLEQMLQLMRNQSNEYLNNDPRPIFDRPPVYPVKSMNSLDSRKELLYDPIRSPNPKHPNDYAQAAYEQVNKKLFMDDDKKFDPYSQNFSSEPRIVPQKTDVFEKSLAGQSTFIDPLNSKWNSLGNNESSPSEANSAPKNRKKWDTNETSHENFSENKALVFEKYSAKNNLAGLELIDEGDESLTGQGTHIGFNDTSKQKIDEDFYKEFKKKYIGQQYSNENEDGIRENKEFHGFQDSRNKDNPDETPFRPIGPELFDKVFGNKPEPSEPSTRKDSAKGRRAFSRLNDAKKFTMDSEKHSEPTSELFGPSDYLPTEENPENH